MNASQLPLTASQETLSTLKYASLSQSVSNRPAVNCDPTVKLIRSLRRRVKILQTQLNEAEADAFKKVDNDATNTQEQLWKLQRSQEKLKLDCEHLTIEVRHGPCLRS